MSVENSTPLLLLHGFPMDARMWRHVVSHFQPERPVIAPNPADLVADGPTMAGMAARAIAALDESAPGRAAVAVGLSMGGYIAEEIARAFPERLSALVLSDTRATADTPEARAGREAMIEAARKYGVVHATAPMLPNLLHDPPRVTLSEVERMIGDYETDVLVACIEAMRDRREQVDTLRGLTVPLLVVAGENDVISPPEVGAAIAGLAPHGRFTAIPRSGHVPPLENPSEFISLLDDFLCEANL